MKRKKRKRFSQCTIVILSVSMVAPCMLPAFSAYADIPVRDAVRQITIASPSEALKSGFQDDDHIIQDEDILNIGSTVASPSEAAPEEQKRSSYPAFGTVRFWEWYGTLYEAMADGGEEEMERYEEAVEGWYNAYAVLSKTATGSNADRAYPTFDDSLGPENSPFWKWFYDTAVIVNQEGKLISYKNDVILDWIWEAEYEEVLHFFEALYMLRQTGTLSVIGNLWPDGYGAAGDLYSRGSGTQESPYVIDSVEDLRLMAVHIAIDDRNEDTYYLIKKGTYDLNGAWIPIGFPVNDGGNAIAFKGHLAAEDGANIKNLGFNAYSILGITSNLAAQIRSQRAVGFFGELGAGATVHNLYLDTSKNTLQGTDYAGILAGHAVDASIKNCTVTGTVKGIGYVGGIVGFAESSQTQIDDRNMVIEDCSANKAAVYTTASAQGSASLDGHSCVGGIVGLASNATIMDTYVSTNTGAGNHIYGNGAYVGGIAGVIENSDIYNSYVSDGNIGESNAYAVGGIAGGYAGGQMKVSRFSGTIVRPTSTNNYSAAFIGARVHGSGFTYGEDGDISHLFADTKAKADTGICGSRIEDDGIYDDSAHIGYWHSADNYFTLCSGSNVNHSDRYFYTELENGVLNTKRSGINTDSINHFTADQQGRPVRGYLLTITDPTVDGTKAADISAYINGTYKPVVTSDSAGAFAAGDVVYLSFADRSDGSAYFQMADKPQNPFYSYYKRDPFQGYDSEVTVAGVTKGAGYYFRMPDSDVTVGAEYKRVSQAVTTDPNKIVYEITQVRSGSRENPTIEWYATAYDGNKDISGNANVITDADGRKWENIKLATIPAGQEASYYDEMFQIGSLVNGSNNNTFNLRWQTGNDGNSNIIGNPVPANGNVADKKAYITINVKDSALTEKINELARAQAAGGYKDSMTTNAPYWFHALVTATAQVEDSEDKNNPPKGYTDIDIKLNVKDNTNVSVNGVALSKNRLSFEVVRTLSGSRRNPTVRYTVNGVSPDGNTADLSAVFNPDYFTGDDVSWYLSNVLEESDFEQDKNQAVPADKGTKDDGTINVSLAGSGDKAYYHAVVTLKGITENSCENAVLSPLVAAQNSAYTSQMRAVPDTVSTYQKYVKVTADDANNNSVTDTCKVTVNFRTVDQTEILPESVKISGGISPDGSAITGAANLHGYQILYTFAGNKDSEILSRKIVIDNSENTVLSDGRGEIAAAVVGPEYDNTQPQYQPYNKDVVWSLANTSGNSSFNPYDVLKIDSQTGQITVRGYGSSTDSADNAYSPWIQSLIAEGRLEDASVPVRIIAKSVRDNSLVDYKDIMVRFTGNTMENNQEAGLRFEVIKTQEAATSLADTGIAAKESWSGVEGKTIKATATGTNEAPSFTIYDSEGGISTDVLRISDPQTRSVSTEKAVSVKTEAPWIRQIINNRQNSNSGTKELVIQAKTANGVSLSEFPVTVQFRYEGTDMTASTLTGLPDSYLPSPDHIQADTPAETYDIEKASLKDRQITLDVVATQGNYSVNNPGTRKWSYGIVQLHNTTYSSNGVKTNDATYQLEGDIQDYCRIDSNGCLVPIKGNWEDLISAGELKGTVEGIVTARKDIGGRSTSDSYKVKIKFRYDRAVLESHEETFQVVYTQESQTNYVKSHWSGDGHIQLKAHISDENGKDVTPVWESSDESLIKVDTDGRVFVNKDTWMREIIRDAQNYEADTLSGTRTATVTAKHPVTGATADTCQITINFRYDQAKLDRNQEEYNLVLTQTSRTNKPAVKWSGNEARRLNARINLEPGVNNTPHWFTEDASVVSVDENGTIKPAINTDWQNEIIAQHKFFGQKKTAVNVENMGGNVKDSCNIMVNFHFENIEMAENQKTLDVKLVASGSRSNPSYSIEGNNGSVSAVLNSAREGETNIVYTSSDSSVLMIGADGKLALVVPEQMSGTAFSSNASSFIREAMRHPYTASNPYVTTGNLVVTASSEDGRMSDQCNLAVRLTYIDNTYASGGGSSSGGGGGGGSSSKGTSPGGSMSSTATGLPSYVLKGGEWIQNALGHWLYSNGRIFTNEWAAVQNPYADSAKGQPLFDWFHFGSDSSMTTGWYTDEAGDTYYLHDKSDNTLGHMYTGWHWIFDSDGKYRCYYFETESNGFRGRLYKNTITPDGYKVNEKGQWVTERGVITK